MPLLAGVSFDPSVLVLASTAALRAMTAFDTTNLRLSFDSPANGSVLVRIAVTYTGGGGAGSVASILLGVLSGSSVIARQVPQNQGSTTAAANTYNSFESLFTITGLTPGNRNDWDAAYAVQALLAGTNIKYGGPNDATALDAGGGLQYEIYTAEHLLASTLFDPAVRVTVSTTTLAAMTAFDTTNLRLTFTAPASGSVLVRIRVPTQSSGGAATPVVMLGILDGSTVRLRVTPIAQPTSAGVSSRNYYGSEAQGVITGLVGSFTWDAAYAVQSTAGIGFSYGGPNNATGNNASGGFLYEIWAI